MAAPSADLSTHEVYVLAKVLPGFTGEKRHEAYKGVVREALEEGFVNAASSLEVLSRCASSSASPTSEHRQLLDELGVEDPGLLDPDSRRSLEDQIRLSGYRKSLERLMLVQRLGGRPGRPVPKAIRCRRCAAATASPPRRRRRCWAGSRRRPAPPRRLEVLLQRLPDLIEAYPRPAAAVACRRRRWCCALLSGRSRAPGQLSLRAILDGLATLQQDPAVPALVQRLQAIAPLELLELLRRERLGAPPAGDRRRHPVPPRWRGPLLFPGGARRGHPRASWPACRRIASPQTRGRRPVPDGLPRRPAGPGPWRPSWLRPAAPRPCCARPPGPSRPFRALPELRGFPELEKRVFLATSDFFRRSDADTLDALASQADVRSFAKGELITETGDTCRELLLLIEGDARVHHRDGERTWVEDLQPGQVLDELQVLTHSASESTIVAEADGTRLLAVPVDCFDAVLERDPDFARRVLELESGQLQRLMRAGVS